MIVKPSISFLTLDSDPDLIISTGHILAGMASNPNYATPSPTLAVVAAASSAFTTAAAAAKGGGVVLTSVKNDRRAKLVGLLRSLAIYVQGACLGDLTKLLTSGFPIQKPVRTPVGVLPAPVNLVVQHGPRTGELDAKADPIPGASIYNWRLSLAASPATPVQSVQTTAANNTFDRLTPATAYTVEVNAVGSAGPSSWSTPVTQIAV